MTRRQYPPPKKRPYIGVSGLTSEAQAREMLAVLVSQGCDRLLMIGVLASRRSCLGLEQEPVTRHPPPESFPRIFQDHPLALNLIHYHTDRLEDLGAQLSAVSSFGGVYLDGFQLNVSWPPPSELAAFRAERPRMRMVLQIGAAALRDHAPQELAGRIREYEGLADDLLLDASGGTGLPLDPGRTRPYLEALAQCGFCLGVAGGLGPGTLHLADPLLKDFPRLSLDAESGLRDGRDQFDTGRGADYLRGACRFFARSYVV